MSKNKFFILASFIALTLFSSCGSDTQHVIELRLEKGKEYRQKLVSTMGMKQSMMGQEQASNIKMTAEMKYTVQEVLENGYEIVMIYEDVALDLMAGDDGLSLGAGGAGELANLLNQLTDVPLTLKMDKRGKISGISGTEKLFSQLSLDSTDGLTEEQIADLQTRLDDTYGEKAIMNNIQQAFMFFPDHPVAKGDEWSDSMTLAGAFPAKIIATYTLDDVKGKNYIISSSAVMELENTDDAGSALPMSMTMTGNASGEMKVDAGTGWIKSWSADQVFTGEVKIPATEMFPDGFTMPINVELNMEISDE